MLIHVLLQTRICVFINRYLALIIVMNRRYGKATRGQIPGNYELLELWGHLYATSLPVWDLENFRRLVFFLHKVHIQNNDTAIIRSELKREAIACNWGFVRANLYVRTISSIYAYICVCMQLHNLAVYKYVRRSRAGNKAVNVEHVITGDARLCACIRQLPFLVSPPKSGSDHVCIENRTCSRKLSTFRWLCWGHFNRHSLLADFAGTL
jgi:hypothetical protein